MRIIPSVVTAALVAVAFAMLGASPAPSADTKPAAPAVAADAPQSAELMEGCPGKASGAPCCAGCQEKQAQVAAGEAKRSGACPCQERARRLREAQERAKQQ